jgi:hypothetical protein
VREAPNTVGPRLDYTHPPGLEKNKQDSTRCILQRPFTQASEATDVTLGMSATPSDELAATTETTPPSHERPTFSLRVEQVRQVARATASAEVEHILERGEHELHALRERHALELLAAREQANARGIPWWLPLGLAAFAALGVAAFGMSGQAQLSDDPEWAFTLPEIDVAAVVAFSQAHAEREVATGRTVTRSNTRGSRPPRATCDPNSFDPIDACL